MKTTTALLWLSLLAPIFSQEIPVEVRLEGITSAISHQKLSEIYNARTTGDDTAIQKAIRDRDLPLLWRVVVAAKPHNVSPDVLKLHADFREKIRKLLSQIPGHTQGHIDLIEEKAAISKELALRPDGTPNWYPPEGHNIKTMEEHEEWYRKFRRSFVHTDREFIQLSELGSAECVQTLLTYMDDERQVGFVSDDQGRHRPAYPNGCNALDSLRRILGDARPDKDLIGDRETYWAGTMAASCARYREWWLSDKSLPWRGTIFATSRRELLPRASATSTGTVVGETGWFWLAAPAVLVLLSVVLAVKRVKKAK